MRVGEENALLDLCDQACMSDHFLSLIVGQRLRQVPADSIQRAGEARGGDIGLPVCLVEANHAERMMQSLGRRVMLSAKSPLQAGRSPCPGVTRHEEEALVLRLTLWGCAWNT